MKCFVLHKFIKELQHSHIFKRAESREQRAEGWHPFSHHWQVKPKIFTGFLNERDAILLAESSGHGAEDRIPFSSLAGKSDKQ